MDDIFCNDLASIYSEKRNQYIKTALHYVHCYNDAEDIVQEAVLGLIRASTKNVNLSKSEMHYYLLAAIKNRCISFLQSKQFHALMMCEQNSINSESAEETAITRLSIRMILAKLPNKYRSLIIKKYYEGMNNSEIAKILNIKASSVNMTLKRAKEKFRSTYVLEKEKSDNKVI